MTDNTKNTDGITHHLNQMYQNWFLDYASYVILERAVPHVVDGFKPVGGMTGIKDCAPEDE